MKPDLEIRRDDLTGPEIRQLLEEHLEHLRSLSPPGSVHALDLERLRKPDITFWSAWRMGELAGCGALKDLGGGHGEVKSMRTRAAHLRCGVARAILERVVGEAAGRGYVRLSLETGASAPFEPAWRLYRSFGFEPCGPFGDYRPDPNSLFFTLRLGGGGAGPRLVSR